MVTSTPQESEDLLTKPALLPVLKGGHNSCYVLWQLLKQWGLEVREEQLFK